MSIKDLISAAMSKDASAFETAFSNVMADKMGAAVTNFLAPEMADVQEEEAELEEVEESSDEGDLGEEVEQIDELSNKTLSSYVNKAAGDVKKRAQSAYGEYEYGSHDAGAKEDDKADKRVKGIQRAASKLAKEEVEELDELSKETLKSYSKAASGIYHDKSVPSLAAKGETEFVKGDKSKSYKTYDKASKRADYVAKAIDKLAKD